MERQANIGSRTARSLARRAMLLSSLVLPGAGQMVQKRRVMGVLLAGSFVASFGVFVVTVVRLMIACMTMRDAGFDDSAAVAAETLLIRAGASFGIALAVYTWGLIDTFLANRRLTAAAEEAGGPGGR